MWRAVTCAPGTTAPDGIGHTPADAGVINRLLSDGWLGPRDEQAAKRRTRATLHRTPPRATTPRLRAHECPGDTRTLVRYARGGGGSGVRGGGRDGRVRVDGERRRTQDEAVGRTWHDADVPEQRAERQPPVLSVVWIHIRARERRRCGASGSRDDCRRAQVHSIGRAREPAEDGRHDHERRGLDDEPGRGDRAEHAAKARHRRQCTWTGAPCGRARRAVPQEDVEGQRRSVRLLEIGRHRVAGDVGAGAEAPGRRAEHVADVSDRERADLRLPMAMKRAARVKAGVEDVSSPPTRRACRRSFSATAGWSLRTDTPRGCRGSRDSVRTPRATRRRALVAGRVGDRRRQPLRVVRRDELRLRQLRPRDLRGPAAAVPREARGARVERAEVEVEAVLIGLAAAEPATPPRARRRPASRRARRPA